MDLIENRILDVSNKAFSRITSTDAALKPEPWHQETGIAFSDVLQVLDVANASLSGSFEKEVQRNLNLGVDGYGNAAAMYGAADMLRRLAEAFGSLAAKMRPLTVVEMPGSKVIQG